MTSPRLAAWGFGRPATAVLLATALCVVLGSGVFVAFEPLRVRAVRTPTLATAGRFQVEISAPVGLARGPFALIARIRNDADLPAVYSVHADGRPTCTATVPPKATRRVDCVAERWPKEIELTRNPAATFWAIEYLEIATHHGASTSVVRAIVLPATSTNYGGVSLAWVVTTWLVLIALLLCPSHELKSRRVKHLHRAVVGAAWVLFGTVLIAPLVSQYRVVLSLWTFVGWSALVLAPRLAWLAQRTGLFTSGWRVAWLPAAAVVLLGVLYGQREVGGADTYGYVSQADLWLRGDLTIEQPFVADMPWPNAARAFAPLGYGLRSDQDSSLVPAYSPGLPMMMAAAKWLAGHDAVFFVVPVCAGVLVLATVGIAQSLSTGMGPAVAAWLGATSPVVLAYATTPMSDGPAAAAWTVAFYLLLRPASGWAAAGAGLASAVAVLIRPNLVLLAPILGLHYVLAMRHAEHRRTAILHLVLYSLAASSGALAIAALNQQLYGSPFRSGYGELQDLFSAARIGPNLRNYLQWLTDAHTPLVLIGLAALAVPLRRIWPGVKDRSVFITIGAFVLAVWAIYCVWHVFDSWWFSRFLLPSWPFIVVGVAAAAEAARRALGPSALRHVVALSMIGVALSQVKFSQDNQVLSRGSGERRYAAVAHLARDTTRPNSVVIAWHHGGSIRYYGERMTMDFTHMEEGTLDLVVGWLLDRGVRTYAALEDWEIPLFRERFAGARRLAALDGAPDSLFEDPGRVLLFDLSAQERSTAEPRVTRGLDRSWRAVPPGPPPTLQYPSRR